MIKLHLNNFGRYSDTTFNLGKATLIKGTNGIGKSTILEAINYSLVGSVRRLPKKNEELIKLANKNTDSTDFTVTLDINGNTVSRGLVKGKTVKEHLTTNLIDSKSSLAEKNLIIKDNFNIQEELLNPIKLTALTPSEKSKYLLSLLKSTSTHEKLLNIIKVIPELTDIYSDNVDLFENIELIKQNISVFKKSLTSQLKEIDLRNTDISAMKQELMNLPTIDKNQYTNLINEITSLKSKIANIKKSKEKYSLLKKELQNLDSENTSNVDITIKTLTDNIAVSKQKIVSTKGIEITIDSLRKELEVLTNDMNNLNIEYTKLLSEINHITERGQGFTALTTSKKCVVDSNIICNSCNDFSKATEALRNLLREKFSSKGTLIAKTTELKSKHDEISKKLDYALNLQKNLINSNDKLNKHIINLQEKINALLVGSMNSKKKKEVLASQLKDIKIEDESILEKLLKTKELESSTVLEKIETYTKLKTNIELAEKSDLNIDLIKEKIAILKNVAKELDSYKLELINSSISPFLNKMNEILDDIGYDKKAFIASDGKKATVGFTNGKTNIEFDTLSTGEGNIFIIALIGAIYSVNQSNFKVIALDDLDNIDSENLNRLLLAIPKLSKYFDNIILLGVLEHLKKTSFKDLTIIDLDMLNKKKSETLNSVPASNIEATDDYALIKDSEDEIISSNGWKTLTPGDKEYLVINKEFNEGFDDSYDLFKLMDDLDTEELNKK